MREKGERRDRRREERESGIANVDWSTEKNKEEEDNNRRKKEE